MEKKKELLFSVTKNDCEFQTFRSGGKGGQNVNKVESGVRCIHKASGAVGQATDTRDQFRNKRLAFLRMAQTSKFKAWHRMETARCLGQPSIDEIVSDQMQEHNLKIEYK